MCGGGGGRGRGGGFAGRGGPPRRGGGFDAGRGRGGGGGYGGGRGGYDAGRGRPSDEFRKRPRDAEAGFGDDKRARTFPRSDRWRDPLRFLNLNCNHFFAETSGTLY